jgi:hypothetical protein
VQFILFGLPNNSESDENKTKGGETMFAYWTRQEAVGKCEVIKMPALTKASGQVTFKSDK